MVSDLTNNTSLFSNPLSVTLMMMALGLIPFAMLSVTSFIKLHVVFNVLKNALGAQQIPSGAVVSVLSLVLTAYIMQPVAEQSIAAIEVMPNQKSSMSEILASGKAAVQPLIHFLSKNSRARERLFFRDLQQRGAATELKPADEKLPACAEGTAPGVCILPGEGLFTLVPAFVLSELREAFSIGFLLFLPFLVVDLIVANLLVGVGMSMVTPATVSLPLKIVLFVSCDGWFLLCRSLILGYR